MWVSDFWNRMDEELGRAYAGSLSKSLVLAALGDCTVVGAVERGANLREVWHAVCDAMDVPAARRGPKHLLTGQVEAKRALPSVQWRQRSPVPSTRTREAPAPAPCGRVRR